MGETFTKWAWRNRNRHRIGHMTNEEARDEIRPLLATEKPARGHTFTHPRLLEPTWEPGPGQKYADGPKAVCLVTRVSSTQVWYKYLSYALTGVVGDPISKKPAFVMRLEDYPGSNDLRFFTIGSSKKPIGLI